MKQNKNSKNSSQQEVMKDDAPYTPENVETVKSEEVVETENVETVKSEEVVETENVETVKSEDTTSTENLENPKLEEEVLQPVVTTPAVTKTTKAGLKFSSEYEKRAKRLKLL